MKLLGIYSTVQKLKIDAIMLRYSNLDKAHSHKHIMIVLDNAQKYYHHINDKHTIHINMVELAALYHDIGRVVGDDLHHIYSSSIFSDDRYIWKDLLTDLQFSMVNNAILNHRASSFNTLRNPSELDKYIRCCDALSPHKFTMWRAFNSRQHKNPLDDKNSVIKAIEHIEDKYTGCSAYASELPLQWANEIQDTELHIMRIEIEKCKKDWTYYLHYIKDIT